MLDAGDRSVAQRGVPATQEQYNVFVPFSLVRIEHKYKSIVGSCLLFDIKRNLKYKLKYKIFLLPFLWHPHKLISEDVCPSVSFSLCHKDSHASKT